jgi:serine/threonine-protein kinase RsbW
MKRFKTIKLKASLDNIPEAMDCVAQSAQAAGLDEQTVLQIQLAVDEACANVVDHAYEGMDPGEMEISCALEDQAITIRVRDWGRGFDPDCIEEPDITAPLEQRSPGGLGLFLIRQTMDQVKFTIDPEQGNELTMIKRLRGVEQ